MEQYLRHMLDHTNAVISHVISEIFHTRPHLLAQMRSMHGEIERQLKLECQRELELMLDMETSFVYADNPLYRESLQRTKRAHAQASADPAWTTTTSQSARPLYTTGGSSVTNSAIAPSLKRTNGAMSEDDDRDEDTSQKAKISRRSEERRVGKEC